MINQDALETLLSQNTRRGDYAVCQYGDFYTSASSFAKALTQLKRGYHFEFVACVGSRLVILDCLEPGYYRTPEGVRH